MTRTQFSVISFLGLWLAYSALHFVVISPVSAVWDWHQHRNDASMEQHAPSVGYVDGRDLAGGRAKGRFARDF